MGIKNGVRPGRDAKRACEARAIRTRQSTLNSALCAFRAVVQFEHPTGARKVMGSIQIFVPSSCRTAKRTSFFIVTWYQTLLDYFKEKYFL